MDSIWIKCTEYWMARVGSGVDFHTFRAHKFQTYSFSAEVGYRFTTMFHTGDEITEVGLHVFKAECTIHVVDVAVS